MLALHHLACYLLIAAGAAAAEEIQIDPGPGGNIVVQRIDGQTAFVAPDQRDIQKGQWWFYWSFRLRAPVQRPVTIVFSGQNPLGVRGPAMSLDGGATWQWLGAASVQPLQHEGKPAWSFVASVPDGHGDVLYAFCPHYRESHLRAWLAKQAPDAPLRVEELCRSRQGRSVELLRAGCLDRRRSRGVVLLTSRHHACEAMATYALEGFWNKEQQYAAILARVRSGPLPFREGDCLPFGTAWNTGGNYAQGRSCSAWSLTAFPQAELVASLELAYADALGVEVTADGARAFGRDLAHALAEMLD